MDAIVAQMPLPTGGECKLVQQYEDKLQACKEEVRVSPLSCARRLSRLSPHSSTIVHTAHHGSSQPILTFRIAQRARLPL